MKEDIDWTDFVKKNTALRLIVIALISLLLYILLVFICNTLSDKISPDYKGFLLEIPMSFFVTCLAIMLIDGINKESNDKIVQEMIKKMFVSRDAKTLHEVYSLDERRKLIEGSLDSMSNEERAETLKSQFKRHREIVLPLYSDEEEIVEISIMENQVLFKTENMYFYSRLLEGNYPDTNRLIPSSFNTEVEFSVPSFLAAIERASLLSHEGRNNIVRLSIQSDAVILYGNSPEIGKVEESLNYVASSGDPLDISFNPDYMKAALRAFGDMSIKVKFISSIRPFTLEPTEDGVQFIQLITPVRTN